MSLTSSLLRFLLSTTAIAALVTSSAAAPITWGSASNISGDSDVNTLGTLVAAFNVGPNGVPDTTVNGVLFQGFPVVTFSSGATSGNFAFTTMPITSSFLSESDFGSAMPPFSNLSAPYQTLLSSGTGTPQGVVVLTISGLSLGTLYQFQWWDNNSNLAGEEFRPRRQPGQR